MPTGAAQADGSMKVESTFDVEHVASTVVYMSNMPLDTNVQFVTIMAIDMPYIGPRVAGARLRLSWLTNDGAGVRQNPAARLRP